LSVSGDTGALAEDVSTTLFRVVQESVANVRKHAAASKVDVALVVDEGVRLAIRDDGRWSEHDPHAVDGGLGLASMRQRASGLGGGLVVAHPSTGGTEIVLTLPAATGAVSVPKTVTGGPVRRVLLVD